MLGMDVNQPRGDALQYLDVDRRVVDERARAPGPVDNPAYNQTIFINLDIVLFQNILENHV